MESGHTVPMRPKDLRRAANAKPPGVCLNRPIGVRFFPAAAWMGLLFLLSSRSELPEPLGPRLTAVAGHFSVYAVLAVLLWWGLACWGLTPGWRLAVSFVGVVAFGLSDEWHQVFVPGRDPALFDLGMDGLGALASLTAVTVGLRAGKPTGAQPVREHSTE
jgi:VanZ family protein